MGHKAWLRWKGIKDDIYYLDRSQTIPLTSISSKTDKGH
ncbi:MAG: hypothetical protein ACI8YQ_001546 [Polaribacter sp.]|jgi:hypothetical protein